MRWSSRLCLEMLQRCGWIVDNFGHTRTWVRHPDTGRAGTVPGAESPRSPWSTAQWATVKSELKLTPEEIFNG
jgi:hypothetical protein